MSQAGSLTTGGSSPLPPTVATSYVTDVNSPAIPSSNVLNVVGGSIDTNNANGIQTDGSSGSNTLTIQLTNRVQGDVTTTTNSVTPIISFNLGSTPGVYTFTGDITAYDLTDVAGASYGIISGVRTSGSAAIEIGTQFNTNFEEVAMMNAEIDVTVSGNDVIFEVQGLTGKAIDWDALFTFRFVG